LHTVGEEIGGKHDGLAIVGGAAVAARNMHHVVFEALEAGKAEIGHGAVLRVGPLALQQLPEAVEGKGRLAQIGKDLPIEPTVG